MLWIDRKLGIKINDLGKQRPAVFLGGVRQAGKSSLLRHLFPQYSYVTLDHVDKAIEAVENPKRFLTNAAGPLIIDEIQYAPQLFRELKILIDQDRQQYGRFYLTGSQRFELMKGIQESLAGRLGLAHLETLGIAELRAAGFSHHQLDQLFLRGGYPELWSEAQLNPQLFYEDYLQTYLNRDLQAIIGVEKIRDYRRFLSIAAARVGNLLNFSDMAKDVGVSAVTVKSWVSALETSGIIYLLPPFFANLGKRLTRSPKLYFSDLGLLCHLLRVDDRSALQSSPYWGAVWENFVFCELIKSLGFSPQKDIFFYRDQNAVEIDFLVQGKQSLHLIEAKGSERPSLSKLNFAKVAPLFKPKTVECWLICQIEQVGPVFMKDFTTLNPIMTEWIMA